MGEEYAKAKMSWRADTEKRLKNIEKEIELLKEKIKWLIEDE